MFVSANRPLSQPNHAEEVIQLATGKKAASDAGKVLKDSKATKAEKGAAASDLAQTPHHGQKK